METFQTFNGKLLKGHEKKQQMRITLQEWVNDKQLTREEYDQREEALKKGPISAGDLGSVTPQDIEASAVNKLWEYTDPDELALEKLLPSVEAFQIKHDIANVNAFGFTSVDLAMAENTLPVYNNATFGQDSVYVKLMGTASQVGPIANMQRTVNVLGSFNPVEYELNATILDFYRKVNKARYISDSRTYRGGAQNGLGMEGIFEQIDTKTDGKNVVDCLGGPLTFGQARAGQILTWEKFGGYNTMLMGGATRSAFEASVDTALRNQMFPGIKSLMFGTTLGGLVVNGRQVRFLTDRILGSIVGDGLGQLGECLRPQYDTARPLSGYPTSIPTLGAIDVNPNADSKFDTNPLGAGNWFYVVTYVVNGVQSLGVRSPTGSSLTTIGVGDAATLTVGHPTNATQIVVYRGTSVALGGAGFGLAMTDAWEIMRAPADPSGTTTIVDLNEIRPHTEMAFALTIQGKAMDRFIVNGGDMIQLKNELEQFSDDRSGPQNGVAKVQLGPQGIHQVDLPKWLAQAGNTMIYSPTTVEVRKPQQQLVFTNILPG